MKHIKTDDGTRVVVRGTGVVSALGTGVGECLSNMSAGVRNLSFRNRLSARHPVDYPIFQVPDSIIEKKWENDLTLTSKMGLAAVEQALEQAGLSSDTIASTRVGVCMGTTVGCALNNDPFYMDYKQGKKPGIAPIQRFLTNNPADVIARHFNLSGPVQAIVNACASGTDAVGTAAAWIKAGLCDMAIAGGTDELCNVTFNGFISLMITDPDPCRPFDRDRKGLNLGEGAGVLILEKETKDPQGSCLVAGYGSAGDAHHLTAPRPDGKGLQAALDQAISESGLSPADIGFINAHGTGTKDNDRVEEKILSKVLPGTPFFSTKGYTGHTLGAAGAIEAVFTVHHLLNGEIPGNIGFSNKDPDMTFAPVTGTRKIACRGAVSQSLAFGGTNSVLVFEKT